MTDVEKRAAITWIGVVCAVLACNLGAVVETRTAAVGSTDTPAVGQAPFMKPTRTATAPQPPTPTQAADSLAALIDAAQMEGSLTTIALPHDWCNYGEVISSFKAKYGLEVNEISPDAGSADELEAIRAGRNAGSRDGPDVVDIGFPFTDSAKSDDLLEAYVVSTWDTIPEGAKDPEGYWYGGYYGVISFMVNKDVVADEPHDWVDLLSEEYHSQVGISGDPHRSNEAIQTVYAASLGNGGTLDDVGPGLDFFAELDSVGNLVPVISDNSTSARGVTPVRITWDYLAIAGATVMANGHQIEVVLPETGRLGGIYAQAISAYAPHPNAAKLWMEYLYSDEGQLVWMKGYCHPIRELDMRARGVVPDDLSEKLPDPEGVVFPSTAQLREASRRVTTYWDSVVGADIRSAP
jgi:putative spermidine/putrescine transport system substrate-binding protein